MVDSTAQIAATGHPSGDERFLMLDAAMKRVRYAPEALIEVLHVAQKLFGWLDHGLLHYVSHGLKLPPSRVYGVATFYHLFTLCPGESTPASCARGRLVTCRARGG